MNVENLLIGQKTTPMPEERKAMGLLAVVERHGKRQNVFRHLKRPDDRCKNGTKPDEPPERYHPPKYGHGFVADHLAITTG